MIMIKLEWPMLSYYVIYYEKFRKAMKRTEKVALNLNLKILLIHKLYDWPPTYIIMIMYNNFE